MGCTYLIRNLKNNKCYIGKTINSDKRIREHLNCTPQGSRLVKRAIEKYGRESFVYEILHDGIIPELLDSYEIEAIKTYNSLAPAGYNLTNGGTGGDTFSGKTHSPETRAKISSANKGKTITDKQRKIVSEALKGKPQSPEHIRKRSEARRGQKHSEETKQKMSNVKKGKKLTSDHCSNISKSLKGRTSPNKGKKLSNETKEKMSASQKKIWSDDEHRRRISEQRKGQKHSEETKRKIGEAHKGNTHMLGKTHSEETKRKMSKSQQGKTSWAKGKKFTSEHRRKLSESITKTKSPNKQIFHQFFLSLSSSMSLKEKRKLVREEFPELASTTLNRWTKQWQSESENNN